ncbi:hypothetical protein TIFTF001_049357 [Ficus carica]|uniref:Uncharacterized protein n=1 Tax=Ficus carica TaxID=3494 RepID=A0AA88CRI7_FICCA|nr:hypothetical protein TIFTF001_049357 [Ficus carica]
MNFRIGSARFTILSSVKEDAFINPAKKVVVRFLSSKQEICAKGDQPLLPLLLLLLLTDGFYRLASFKARGAHLFISLFRAYAQDVLRSQQVLRSWATLLARSKLRSIPNDTVTSSSYDLKLDSAYTNNYVVACGQPVLERRHSKKQLPMVWDSPLLMGLILVQIQFVRPEEREINDGATSY